MSKQIFRVNYIIAAALVIAVVGGVAWLAKNKSNSATPASSKMQVTTSFYPLFFITKQIVADKADVVNITPTGSEPHDYEPTTKNIAQLESSKLVVLNGGGLESWGEKIQGNIDPKKTLVLTVGDGLMNQTIITHEGQSGADTHIWLSPVLMQKIAEKVTQGLVQVDPSNAAYYEANAQALVDRLSALDIEYKNGLSQCASRDIVTSHAAFGYLASAYDLQQISITGLSPEAEPSPHQLADVITFVKQNHVKYIFFESLVSPKLSQTIANEVKAQTLVLNPLEGLTPDEVLAGRDYFSEMRGNLANLQMALGCVKN